jgi:RHS repeat-associated protein
MPECQSDFGQPRHGGKDSGIAAVPDPLAGIAQRLAKARAALLALPLALGLSGLTGLAAAPAQAAAVTTVTTTTVYDNFGNPTEITATTSGGGETFVTTTTNTYTNNTAKWHLGRLTRAEVTNTLPDLTSATRVSEFAYDANTGLLTQEVIEPGTALALTTTYTHDAFGNRLSATVSGSDFVSRTTSTTYSADGRFAVSATNALGHTETRSHDGRFGTVSSLTGPNGLTTTWEYDGFGRKVREARADGTETQWGFALCAGSCPTGGIYWVEERQVITATGFDYAARAKIYFDKLNREFRKEVEGFDGTPVYVDTVYNALGQVIETSRPYFQGTPAQDIQWTLAAYDAIGRVVSTTAPDGGVTSVAYDGLTTTTTNALNQDATEVKNAIGQVVEARDNLNGANRYFYDPFGNLVETLDEASNQAFMDYDIRGRKIQMDDPDMGIWTYSYNALGELVSQTDAKFQSVTMAYDKLGRMVSRTEAEGTTTWTYDTAATGIGKIHQVTGPGYASTASYDSLGRPSSTSEIIGGEVFATSVTYDAAGRVATQTYPSGFALERNYTFTGFLEEVREAGGLTVYWAANAVNAEGQVTEEVLGNGLVTQRAYDPETGTVEAIQTWNGLTAVQDDLFDFDLVGNLVQRIDAIQGRQEDFAYDGLNRLTDSELKDSFTLTVLNSTSLTYDSVGNIASKSDVGNYAYTGTSPHAVSGVSGGPAGTLAYSYDANGNMTAGAGRTLTWSSFNKPVYIDGGAVLSFTYGPDRARIMQVATSGGGVKTIKYVGSLYEKRQVGSNPAELVHYIRAAGTVAIYTEVDDQNPASDKTRYLHRDHLDSIVALTDEAGAVAERLSFDAHGARRETTWMPAAFPIAGAETPRGFTGHEHLDGVALIHMNGRVYDPMLGRFLSADPIVQFPKSTQGLNRYTYTNNNPLSFFDPSGFGFFSKIKSIFNKAATRFREHNDIIHLGLFRNKVNAVKNKALQNQYVQIAAYAVATFYGGAWGAAAVSHEIAIAKGAEPFDAVVAAGITYATAAVTAGAGVVAGPAGRIVAQGVVSGVTSQLRGGSFGRGFAFGSITAVVQVGISSIGGQNIQGAAVRILASAVAGGAISRLGGEKFKNGAITAAFYQLYAEYTVGNLSRRGAQYAQRPSPADVQLAKGGNENYLSEFGFGDEGLGDVYDNIGISTPDSRLPRGVRPGSDMSLSIPEVPNSIDGLFSGDRSFQISAKSKPRTCVNCGAKTGGVYYPYCPDCYIKSLDPDGGVVPIVKIPPPLKK